MFKAGDRVTLIRHDQYPSLVGLEGTVQARGMKDPNRAVSPEAGNVYQVVAKTRTLHDIPEAWLKQAGNGGRR